MTAERKFKIDMLAKLREFLTDGKQRPAWLVERYKATVTKLEREIG